MIFCQLLTRLQFKQVESIDMTHCVSYPFLLDFVCNVIKIFTDTE